MRKLVLLAGAAMCWAVPAAAQSGLDGRVGKLESEMRAVQRKVFPGGTPSIEPQITGAPAPEREIGAPATPVIADLTQRVGSLEQQMASMTGQIEQAQYRVRQLEEQFAAYRKEVDARFNSAGPAPGTGGPVESTGATTPAPAVPAPGRKPEASAPAPAAGKDPARAKLVAAIEKPSTAQPDEDDYIYGYRLWAAKLYPEAEAQFRKVVADYPRSRRASYAQNLLGRSYLDDGKPSLASIAFYDNYKKMPDGERAPESLYYLGQALMKLNKPADACKVYGELTDVYGAKIDAAMQANIARARVAAKCK